MAQLKRLFFHNTSFCQLMFDFCQLVDEVRDLNRIFDENSFHARVVEDDVDLGDVAAGVPRVTLSSCCLNNAVGKKNNKKECEYL